MNSPNRNTFEAAVLSHYIPCLFVGVILLYATNLLLSDDTFARLLDNRLTGLDLVTATIVGLGTAGVAVAYHLWRNRHMRLIGADTLAADKRMISMGATVGLLAGASDVLLMLHTEGIMALTIIVLVILFWNLRVFTGKMAAMLHPDSVATWRDVAELARIYLAMLAGFTLVNATLEGARLLAGRPPAFGFLDKGDLFLNSLYYTVVTMTSLGYGDITPRTGGAKLLISFECLLSYVMFALVIGIITRGVIRNEKTG